MTDQLSDTKFTCCKCLKECDVEDGTWLPVGESTHALMVNEYEGGSLKVLDWSGLLQPPELITSDEFTCYDCTP